MAISTLVKKFIPHAVIVATAALAAIAAVAPAQALTFYSDRAAFNAGSKNLQNIDFEDLHTDHNNYWGYTSYGNSTITEKGVQFTDSYKLGMGGSSYSNYYGLGSGDVLYSSSYSYSHSGSYGGNSYSGSYDNGSNLLNILLPSDTTAIAFDFKNLSGGSVFKMSIDDQVFDFNPSINFVGFTSDTAISSIKFLGTPNDSSYNYSYGYDINYDGVIDSNDTYSYSQTGFNSSVSLDNFTFGEAATSVPEPTSVLGLLAVGALGAGSQIKRKQQGKA
ncbi:PEP-CTERM sorting domain-containing protein [Trichocoleus sp. DQ-A3]|uniref:PEP-CTERM sorting domain-containing protein n=1 Tax=Cyanophyceae TaxID=3028117 RepID=UPI0016883CCE|nr:PEP-CTERM sorting domain-containing protein [Coleofasciculus sp. FACHB-125]MBD1900039.1 PEP-CTERM sorting domain-containing protein [Coleofasciculus sp. FACHB-125]